MMDLWVGYENQCLGISIENDNERTDDDKSFS